jgi:hypothetical protein
MEFREEQEAFPNEIHSHPTGMKISVAIRGQRGLF